MYSFPGGSSDKESACQCKRHRQETQVQYLGREDPLKEEMATHSSILAWRVPWTKEAIVHGVAESKMPDQLSIHTCALLPNKFQIVSEDVS